MMVVQRTLGRSGAVLLAGLAYGALASLTPVVLPAFARAVEGGWAAAVRVPGLAPALELANRSPGAVFLWLAVAGGLVLLGAAGWVREPDRSPPRPGTPIDP